VDKAQAKVTIFKLKIGRRLWVHRSTFAAPADILVAMTKIGRALVCTIAIQHAILSAAFTASPTHGPHLRVNVASNTGSPKSQGVSTWQV
jgi:hypothetical protein